MIRTLRNAAALLLAALLPSLAQAQNLVRIDASAPPDAPQPVAAKLGSSRSPSGDTIGANSQFLTFNGKPWIPVMGEFHFSRYPPAQWEQEILKMKAAGVGIVSAYIIWIHHEQNQGVFDWSGQRDLRHFTELCARHGMYVYPRIGPWAHAETRNGGLPDWVLKAGPTRQNDPIYLKEVSAFYAEIGKQLQGQMWKDGGPVIGIQIENEYRTRGAGKGDEHLHTLKQMAIDSGFDVPLYTVTGWDGAAIPLDAVLPVFGGYPDAPWDASPKKLSANEVYAFRFTNRSAGSMGAIGGRNQSPASTYRGTPFLTAEVGDGIEDTYFRRPVVSPDDVAAIPTIVLGSGANLLGYYMFHGGRNPDPEAASEGSPITLQESQVTGYPTDVPVRSYDFQAPLGEFGQARESLRKLKLVHYFLNDFGATLAPMAPHAPAAVPSNPGDLTVPRVAARTAGDQGFVFLSNYVRGAEMPARPGFQVELKLPASTIRIPDSPVNLPTGTYGIWPVNLPLPGGATLRYSTAQLFKRVDLAGQTYLFFFTLPGVPPEFAFAGNPAIKVDGAPARTERGPDLLRLHLSPTASTELIVPGGTHLVLLPKDGAESIWRVDDPTLLLSTRAMAFSDAATWTLQSDGENVIDLGVFGSRGQPSGAALQPIPTPTQPQLFVRYRATLPAVSLKPVVTPVAPAGPLPPPKFGPKLSWRPNPLPLAPDDADFEHAAAWKIDIPALPPGASLSDAFLQIDYQGDVARLYRDTALLDDSFWNGLPWSIGLREVSPAWPGAKCSFNLRILPLAKNFPMYFEEADKLHFANPVADSLEAVRIIPQYQIVLQAPPPAK